MKSIISWLIVYAFALFALFPAIWLLVEISGIYSAVVSEGFYWVAGIAVIHLVIKLAVSSKKQMEGWF